MKIKSPGQNPVPLFLMFPRFFSGTRSSPSEKYRKKREIQNKISVRYAEIEDLENQKEKILSEITAIDGKYQIY